jgi:hypothetical protein
VAHVITLECHHDCWVEWLQEGGCIGWMLNLDVWIGETKILQIPWDILKNKGNLKMLDAWTLDAFFTTTFTGMAFPLTTVLLTDGCVSCSSHSTFGGRGHDNLHKKCFIYTNFLTHYYTYVTTFDLNCLMHYGVFHTIIRSTYLLPIIPGYSVRYKQHYVRLLLLILTTYKNHIVTVTICLLKHCKITLN